MLFDFQNGLIKDIRLSPKAREVLASMTKKIICLKNTVILIMFVFAAQFVFAQSDRTEISKTITGAGSFGQDRNAANNTRNIHKDAVFSIENIKIPFQPDYSKQERWALLPEDDSKYKADVFYVYPTIFGGQGYELMDVSDDDLKKKARNQALFHTGIFEGQANIYAPFYRQASIEILKLTIEQNEQILNTGINDIEQAFDYYLKHYNKGKPFILAGFSQGSIAVLEIMKNKFYNKQLTDKLIAAYIIGFSVTESDLKKYPWLKMAKKADDTGVIISYNTQIANNGYSYLLHKGSKAINPVTWKTDNEKSKQHQYKGALMFDSQSGTISGEEFPFKTAYLEPETNALVVDVDEEKYAVNGSVFPKGILHIYDYMFFYNNLRQNVPQRISSYFKKHK